jgi:NAD+ kinase
MPLRVAVRGDADGPLRGRPREGDGASDPAVVAVERERDADLVLAVGDGALCSLIDDPAPAPTLPVATSVGRHGCGRDRVDAVLAALASSGLDGLTVAHPVLTVDAAGADTLDAGPRSQALLDVALVTSEPAHISEYTVADGAGDLASFRADGVVVATPAGSAGYGAAAGGPVLAAGSGLAVVPVSPYTTDPHTWVVDPPVELGVERDESPVSLVVDGREVGTVPVERAVRLTVDRTVDLLRPPGSGGGARRLEKL